LSSEIFYTKSVRIHNIVWNIPLVIFVVVTERACKMCLTALLPRSSADGKLQLQNCIADSPQPVLQLAALPVVVVNWTKTRDTFLYWNTGTLCTAALMLSRGTFHWNVFRPLRAAVLSEFWLKFIRIVYSHKMPCIYPDFFLNIITLIRTFLLLTWCV